MLEIPDWVPQSVAAIAREMHGSLNTGVPQLKAYADAIERLACDCRMRPVWKELGARNRTVAPRGGFMHPALPGSVRCHKLVKTATRMTKALPAADRLQHQAMLILFAEAAQLCAWDRSGNGPRTQTRKEIDREAGKLRATASRLRDDACRLRKLGRPHFVSAIEKAADDCIAQANMRVPYDNDNFLTARSSKRLGGPWVQGFIISMANLYEYLFGQRMLGLVATMTNVAMQRGDLTEDRIRGVFRRTSGVKRRPELR